VRVVRDKATNLGKGFAYVMFRDKGAVKAAVALDGLKLRGRKLRVTRVGGLPSCACL
jgi:nucleolar protein 12